MFAGYSLSCSGESWLLARASLRLLQWNADGIGNKKRKHKVLIENLDVYTVQLQKFILRPSSKNSIFLNFTTINVYRPNGDGCGSLLALIKKDVSFIDFTAEIFTNIPVSRTRKIQCRLESIARIFIWLISIPNHKGLVLESILQENSQGSVKTVL